jgi:hypothetical protein
LVETLPGAIGLEDSVRVAIADHGEDSVSRTRARLARSGSSRLWKAAYARSPDRFSALTRFLTAHPATLETVLTAQRERAERDMGQDLVLGWVLNLLARYQLATDASIDGWLVIDEGFCQRGVALLGYGFLPDDEPLLAGYLSSIPPPDAVVMVDTPIETCRQRLDQRGWSERVRDLDEARRNGFLDSAAGVARSIATQLEGTGIRVIWVDGTMPVPVSASQVGATLGGWSD